MPCPTRLDVMRHLSEHYNVPTTELLALLYVPTHPHTLRDDFAQAALPCCIVNTSQPGWQAAAAWKAYSMADAMLEARKPKE